MSDQAQAFLNHGNVDQWTRGANPAEKAEWGKCGVKTEQDANKIGAGIFRFGELVAA